MDMIWKKYEQTELTHSSVHHLLALDGAAKENGYARAVDIAENLHISRASVSMTMSKLKEKGYVIEDGNHFLSLSKKGRRIVSAVQSNRHVIQMFFSRILGLDETEAEIEACKIEHLLSEKGSRQLTALVGSVLSDPAVLGTIQKSLHEFLTTCGDPRNCAVCLSECILRGAGNHG